MSEVLALGETPRSIWAQNEPPATPKASEPAMASVHSNVTRIKLWRAERDPHCHRRKAYVTERAKIGTAQTNGLTSARVMPVS